MGDLLERAIAVAVVVLSGTAAIPIDRALVDYCVVLERPSPLLERYTFQICPFISDPVAVIISEI